MPMRRCLPCYSFWVPFLLAGSWLAGQSPSRGIELAAIVFIMALPFLGLSLLQPRLLPVAMSGYGLWSFLWAASVQIELYLATRYQLMPQSREVMTALLDTQGREVREMLTLLALPVAAALGVAGGFAVLQGRALRLAHRAVQDRIRPGSLRLVAAGGFMVVTVALHGNVVVETSDPLTLWSAVLNEGIEVQRQEADLAEARRAADQNIPTWKPHYDGPPEKTVVVFIGESSNRWNWSLYGYARHTTPGLERMRDHLLIFRDVISSYGSTIVELTRALTPADRLDDERWRTDPGVLALAKAAGYRVFWLTNQSSSYIDTLFGGEADVFRSVYSGRNGRHDGSQDGKLLPELRAALADPAPRKLIVLQGLGSHDRYALRYPPAFDVFGHQQDAVDRALSDRWWWVRQARAAYDNSILYTDWMITQVIEMLAHSARGDAGFLYFSDHAQDVGHLTSSWGHQFWLESGFTIPLILWRNRPGFPDSKERAMQDRPYQTDRLDWTLLSLLEISTLQDRPTDDLLGEAFRPWKRAIRGKAYVAGHSHRSIAELPATAL